MVETEQRYFEDIDIGQEFAAPSQAISDAHLTLFAGLSADFHPLHIDEHYSKEGKFGTRVAHGMMITMFTVIGATELAKHTEETGRAFLNQSSTFRHPVFTGDTVYPEIEVTDKEDKGDRGIITFESRIYNQDDEKILDGSLEFLIDCRED